MIRSVRLAGLGLAFFLHSPGAWADDKPLPADRIAISSCLEAANAGQRKPESCIGAVQGACIRQPGGDTTIGMKECGGREISAWDERLNAAYRAALAGPVGTQEAVRGGGRKLTGADILRDAQRAWIAFRDKKCDAAGLPMEGGTGAGLLSVDCYLGETGRQALWLEGLKEP